MLDISTISRVFEAIASSRPQQDLPVRAMPPGIDPVVRAAVQKELDAGFAVSDISRHLFNAGVPLSERILFRLKARWRATGSIAPIASNAGRRRAIEPEQAAVSLLPLCRYLLTSL